MRVLAKKQARLYDVHLTADGRTHMIEAYAVDPLAAAEFAAHVLPPNSYEAEVFAAENGARTRCSVEVTEDRVKAWPAPRPGWMQEEHGE